MPDYALMNHCLYEGKAKDVEQTDDAMPWPRAARPRRCSRRASSPA